MTQRMLREAVQEEMETRKRRRSMSFVEFCEHVSPSLDWRLPHTKYLCEVAQQMADGLLKRVIVLMPPQHGKSETFTIHLNAYKLYRDPSKRIVLGANTQRLVNTFSRRIRRLVEELIPLADDQQAVESWATSGGGGLRAVGIGASVTGNPADELHIDDPIVGAEDAESQSQRNKIWEWYAFEAATRVPKYAPRTLITTRWHEDDIVGRILGSEDAHLWTVIDIKALAEENDPLGRSEGQALFPARFDEEYLAQQKRDMGERAFNALYQNNPKPREGLMFKTSKLNYIDAHEVPENARYVRYWDKAGTEGGDGAETAGVKMGMTGAGKDRRFYVVDVVHGRWSALQREEQMRQTAEMDGRDTDVWIEQEPGSGGKESAESTVANLSGFKVYKEIVSGKGSKELRAETFSAQVEAGTVYIVRAPWNQQYRDQLGGFPHGKLKDMVDGSSGAFRKLIDAPMGASFRGWE